MSRSYCGECAEGPQRIVVEPSRAVCYRRDAGAQSVIAALIALAHILLAIGVSGHIILTKDDVRSAIGWVGLVWLAPVMGSVLYMLLGVNRISRRAGAMRGRVPLDAEDRAQTVRARTALVAAACLEPDAPAALHAIARLVGTVTRQPLTARMRDRSAAQWR